MPVPKRTLIRSAEILVLVLLALTAVGACSGNGDTNDEETGPPTEEPRATNEDANGGDAPDIDLLRSSAEGALLSLNDFPPGWVQRPPEDDDEDDPEFDLPDECALFIDQADELPPGTIVEVESDEFIGPDDETVQASVAIFETVEDAVSAIAEVRRFIADCREPLRAAVDEIFVAEIERLQEEEGEEPFGEITLSSFSFDLMSFPNMGDETFAARMAFEIQVAFLGIDFYVDLVATRIGRAIGSISYETTFLAPDSEHEQELMEMIEGRLAALVAEID